MTKTYDTIVVGLGAMGSAALYYLAREPGTVLGLDRFSPPHDRGSSHGHSRVIREAYFEHPSYVPLVQQAYENWFQLEKDSGEKLLIPTGGLMMGREEGVLIQGCLLSAKTYDLPYELWTSTEICEHQPAFRPDDHIVGVWEPRAGVLFPEKSIATYLELATDLGADIGLEEPITTWRDEGDHFAVETEKGRYQTKKILFTAGPWTTNLISSLPCSLPCERQALFWFDPSDPDLLAPDRFPIFIYEYEENRFFYGFPAMEKGFKVAHHYGGEITTIEKIRRHVDEGEVAAIESLVHQYLPPASGPLLDTAVCMYTNTPDLHFLLDFHPQYPDRVLVASPCSGHGFKFASVLGQEMANLLQGAPSNFDLSLFSWSRFSSEDQVK